MKNISSIVRLGLIDAVGFSIDTTYQFKCYEVDSI